MAGTPTSSTNGVEIYKQVQGRIECNYEKGVLQDATYYDPPGGGVSSTLYFTEGELKGTDVEQRRAYLKSREFKTLPHFRGRKIYTRKYRCYCYEIDGRFIVIEPIINLLGGWGYFADKAARVLIAKPDGTDEVLYRAAEHCKDLKPSGLTDEEVQRRTSKVKEMGVRIMGSDLAATLGESDSRMGSGIDYRLFCLRDALLIVAGETIEVASIDKPGVTNLTLAEWLATAK